MLYPAIVLLLIWFFAQRTHSYRVLAATNCHKEVLCTAVGTVGDIGNKKVSVLAHRSPPSTTRRAPSWLVPLPSPVLLQLCLVAKRHQDVLRHLFRFLRALAKRVHGSEVTPSQHVTALGGGLTAAEGCRQNHPWCSTSHLGNNLHRRDQGQQQRSNACQTG